MAGLFAIFTTQSNDFALGYPILKSIYSDHPEVCKFIYLLAPVNLVFLNPIGLTCMEINQQVTSSRDDQVWPLTKFSFLMEFFKNYFCKKKISICLGDQ